MLFKFLDATEAKAFGRELAESFMQRVPLDDSSKKKQPKGKRQEAINRVLQQAESYNRDHKPNFYQKSQLGNAFKWTMLDAGYEREFADDLTFQLMLKLR